MSHLKMIDEVIGKKVYAYWNLHKDIWSISDGKHVIYYCHSFEMDHAELRVRQGGYEKARREGKKNVHAFAVGVICSLNCSLPDSDRTISYNHTKGNQFYDKETGQPIVNIGKCYGAHKVLIA